MYFQISPVIHKKPKPLVVHKNTEDEESKVEVLSLAPFTPNPKIVFQDVHIGTVHARKLLIKNPTNHDIHIFVKKFIPEELNLLLSWTEATIEKAGEVPLEMVWSPIDEEASRHSFTLSDGKKINRDVSVTFKSVAPKKAKVTGAKSKPKSEKQKSPLKLTLSKKQVSPLKKLKPQRKSPIKYYSPPKQYYHHHQQYQTKQNQKENAYSPRNRQLERERQLIHKETNYIRQDFPSFPNKENKENFPSPLHQNILGNASASFISPSDATFSMEKVKLDQRRETYVLNTDSERRDTYILQTDTVEKNFETKNTFTIDSCDSSPSFRDSLESPNETMPLREINIPYDGTPTLESMLRQRVTKKPSPNFEYKLKVLESFSFSPALSPYNPKSNFLPTICSTSSKPSSTDNSYETGGKTALELFPQTNQTFQFNVSEDTYTKANVSGDTYVKGNSSFETYIKGNISGGTYVKDSSIGDVDRLDVSPLSSKVFQNPSPVLLRPRSFELSPIVDNNRSFLEARKQQHLSSIAEESAVFSESSLKLGSKRKSPSFYRPSPPKRANIITAPKQDWSKKGGAACRIAKSTSGLNLKQFLSTPKVQNVAQPVSTVTETTVKTLIVQNPFLYANIIDPFMTSSIYCHEEWIEQQQNDFKKWLNMLLTPPEELSTKAEVDVAKVWQECKKKEVLNAPTRESISLNYHMNSKLDYLRKQAQNLFRSKEMSVILQKVCLAVESGKISIREDKDLHLNLKLKSDIMALMLGYNPLWLRIGLETIYNEIIPLKSNSDTHGLANFILERFLKDPHLVKKHKTMYSPKYSSDLKKIILKKFLILVYFLDQAKISKLIQHDPCLFCKNASEKESRLVLIHFARETLSAVGDITKYLKCMGYVVSYVQSYIHEFDYAVKNLGVDLRDGVRLTRVMEIIQMRNDLTSKLRVPAISRLQKIHNMQLVFTSLKESGYEIQYEIFPKDIVDGHKEKTLSFLWQIIYKFEAPLMVQSATTIQTWFRSLPVKLKRMKLQRIRKERETAAKKIQAWFRNQKLSKIYLGLSEFVYRFVQERRRNIAATTIQSYLKMVSCRRKYLSQHYAVTKLQAYAKGWLIRNNYRQRILAAISIQKNYRMYIERKRFLELKKAALIIQRRYRANCMMKTANSAYSDLKRATVLIQRKFRANLEMRRCKKDYVSLRTSVIKIQSYYRMYPLRKRFLELKTVTKIIQTRYRAITAMQTQRSDFLALKKAVVTVQQRYRANNAMKKGRDNFIEIKTACITIQCCFKMYVVRREFLRKKRAAIVIQERYRAMVSMKKQRKEFLMIKETTVVVQRRFRAMIVMRKERQCYLQVKQSCILIQRVYRMFIVRKRFLEVKKAALVLQRRYLAQRYMKQERFAYQKLRSSVLLMQQKWRANRLCKQQRSRFIELRRVAVMIQQRFRANKKMKVERKIYLEVREATIKIQTWYMSSLLMRAFRTQYLAMKKSVLIVEVRYLANKSMRIETARFQSIKKAAIVMQQYYRALVLMRTQRKSYLELKTAAVVVQRRYRATALMKQQKSTYQALKSATIFVQTKFRANIFMKRRRQDYLIKKTAAITIQNWYRATVEMKRCRNYFASLKLAVRVTEEHYKAKKVMEQDRRSFVELKSASVTVQRRYRAVVETRIARKKFLELKNVVVLVQRRFRANKMAYVEREWYQRLRNSAVFVQRRFRAQKSMHSARKEFLALKASVVVVQKRYRAKILMEKHKDIYQKLRSAALVIQRRYRAQKMMIKERGEYEQLRTVVIEVQQRFRASALAKKERAHYLQLRKAVIVTQYRYRAQKLMKIQREKYIMLRTVTVTVQRKFRANVLMNRVREEYLKQMNAAITIQRWYRASRAMIEQKEYYDLLKKTVIMVQQRFRAQRMGRVQRIEFTKLRKAAVVIQRRYRARKSMLMEVESYSRLQWAVLVIQHRYRAQKAMKHEMSKYAKLRHATFVIQRRFRATIFGKLVRERFLKFKASIRIIQYHYRAYVLMKRQRELFLAKYKAAVNLQKFARGYLVRKKYKPMLVPEAVEARRVMKIQSAAAVKIQASWRGYSVRNSDMPEIVAINKIKEMLNEVPRPSVSGRTLAQRCEMAMLCMTNANSSLLHIIRALEDLDFITRHSRDLCIRMSMILPNQLYIIITSAARSPPEMSACNTAAFILINFCKYPPTRANSWDTEYVDTVLNVMLHWCDKESPLFSTLCTLMWLFGHEEEWKRVILGLPNIRQRISKINTLVYRKQNMVTKSTKQQLTPSFFGPIVNTTLPTRTANWGLDYDRPNTFTNAVFALNSLQKILDI